MVSLNLCKEYLKVVTFNTPVLGLLLIRNFDVGLWNAFLSLRVQTGVANVQKQPIFWPSLYVSKYFLTLVDAITVLEVAARTRFANLKYSARNSTVAYKAQLFGLGNNF